MRAALALAIILPVAIGFSGCGQDSAPADSTAAQPVAAAPIPTRDDPLVAALLDAITAEDEAAAMQRVRDGAPANAWGDPRGVTVLHLAARATMPNLCRLLLEQGAEVNARTTNSGHQPIHWAGRAGATPRMERPEGAAEATIDVLLEFGADINAVSDQGTRPIDYAIQLGNEEWIDFLVSRGAE